MKVRDNSGKKELFSIGYHLIIAAQRRLYA